jgi:hypothetical protein
MRKTAFSILQTSALPLGYRAQFSEDRTQINGLWQKSMARIVRAPGFHALLASVASIISDRLSKTRRMGQVEKLDVKNFNLAPSS